jgi:hypothetical protein
MLRYPTLWKKIDSHELHDPRARDPLIKTSFNNVPHTFELIYAIFPLQFRNRLTLLYVHPPLENEVHFESVFFNLGTLQQVCGAGFSDLWIRIRIGDPDPGSRGKKFQWKNALFSYFVKQNLPLKSYKIALTTFEKNCMNNTGIFFYLI